MASHYYTIDEMYTQNALASQFNYLHERLKDLASYRPTAFELQSLKNKIISIRFHRGV